MATIATPTWTNLVIGAVVYFAGLLIVGFLVELAAFEYRRWRLTRRRHRARREASRHDERPNP
jgi:hypothetical protein